MPGTSPCCPPTPTSWRAVKVRGTTRSRPQRLHAAVPGSTFELSPKGFHGSIPAAVKELVTDIAEYFKG